MGYIAKNKIENYEDYLFYCLHVQGSSKSPLNMDISLNRVLKMIRNKLDNIDSISFERSKQIIYDTFLDKRFKLSHEVDSIYRQIVFEKYNFNHYQDVKDLFEKLDKNMVVKYWNKISGLSNISKNDSGAERKNDFLNKVHKKHRVGEKNLEAVKATVYVYGNKYSDKTILEEEKYAQEKLKYNILKSHSEKVERLDKLEKLEKLDRHEKQDASKKINSKKINNNSHSIHGSIS